MVSDELVDFLGLSESAELEAVEVSDELVVSSLSVVCSGIMMELFYWGHILQVTSLVSLVPVEPVEQVEMVLPVVQVLSVMVLSDEYDELPLLEVLGVMLMLEVLPGIMLQVEPSKILILLELFH